MRALALFALAILCGCATTPPEQDPVQIKLNELDARVARLERSVANDVAMSQHLDETQERLRELRGRVEELEHNHETLAKQQRDMYDALDKRLGGGAASPAGAQAVPPVAPDAAPAAGTSSTEQAVYSQAFDALKAGSYSVAIAGFKDFLSSYPDSPLAENAQYWLGETYYVNHDYESASSAFRTVLKKWPDSRKAPDALLKLGYTQLAQKQNAAGRATLTEVTRKYPGSDAAKLATERLRRVGD
ncbi:MAG: tol-pal system protein YbgF [Gammaproteobacteria bacterium]|nr:tol-pal system protein YbgF [Gammaproteobacteria bacterium]MBV9622193.1 tol-pal system protein YbgF [Gammaproteobacteria bacterium]